MSRVTCQLSISLDGFVAGPDQSLEEPLGVGGEALHEWAFPNGVRREVDDQTSVDAEIKSSQLDGVGAFVMGRKMFGGGPGGWDEAWRGWWGDDPPYHAPVFVLTHHPRAAVEMEGGTTFHFVTEGIEAALERARSAAGAQDVAIAGGASTARQYLAAGHIDELHLHLAPVLLGSGERLFEDLRGLALEPTRVVASPVATHITYRVGR